MSSFYSCQNNLVLICIWQYFWTRFLRDIDLIRLCLSIYLWFELNQLSIGLWPRVRSWDWVMYLFLSSIHLCWIPNSENVRRHAHKFSRIDGFLRLSGMMVPILCLSLNIYFSFPSFKFSIWFLLQVIRKRGEKGNSLPVLNTSRRWKEIIFLEWEKMESYGRWRGNLESNVFI